METYILQDWGLMTLYGALLDRAEEVAECTRPLMTRYLGAREEGDKILERLPALDMIQSAHGTLLPQVVVRDRLVVDLDLEASVVDLAAVISFRSEPF
jgi:hypothetical protein